MYAQVKIEMTLWQMAIMEPVVFEAECADKEDCSGAVLFQYHPYTDGTAEMKGAFVPKDKAERILAILKEDCDHEYEDEIARIDCCVECGHRRA